MWVVWHAAIVVTLEQKIGLKKSKKPKKKLTNVRVTVLVDLGGGGDIISCDLMEKLALEERNN